MAQHQVLSLARRDFPGEDPIGKRIQIDGPPGATAAAGATFAPIVGVVADLKYTKLDTEPEPEIFADYRHASPFTIVIVARITGSPLQTAPTIRALVVGVDKSQPVSDVAASWCASHSNGSRITSKDEGSG